ncbi:MAG: Holliday junction resolvase YqgF, putative holliday junction resolvase [Parcubacteria group bacterium]|nr:Holliday junction resolvase YqgF, putative holliday junction resolvase [Parcubacteria group bacterium]
MRYLGIDYGTKKIGLAFSDEEGTMGFPFDIVPNDSQLSDALSLLIEKEHIGGIVIGESRDFAGNLNPIADPARALGEELMERTGVPVHYEPEMLTTQEARRDFEGVHSHKRGDVDSSAAALILTSYLDRKHG